MVLRFLALLYPKPDKVARVEELAQIISDYVRENEPGLLQYQWFKATDTDEQPMIVVWETYADEAALKAHQTSPKTQWLIETSTTEDLMRAPLKILPLDEFAGFGPRL